MDHAAPIVVDSAAQRPFAVVVHVDGERLPRILSTQPTLELAQSLRGALQEDHEALRPLFPRLTPREYSVVVLALDPDAAALAAAFEAATEARLS